MNPPVRVVVVAALAATVALAGCAGVPANATGSDRRPAAVAARSAAPEQVQSFLARVEAAAARQGTVEVIFSGETVDGSGYALLGGAPTGNYVLNMGDTNTQMVVVDGVAYFKDGAVISSRWTSMPAQGVAIGQAFTPQGMFAWMRAGVATVEDLGPDDLYGTPTTRYELVANNAGAPASGVTQALLGSPHPPDTVYSVWVGDDDLIRRVEVLTHGGGLILEYGRWGESMEVVAPPADEVTPLPTR
jgi:hypothetical protein